MSVWIEAGSAGWVALGRGDDVADGLEEVGCPVGLAAAEVPSGAPPDAPGAPEPDDPVAAPVWLPVAEHAEARAPTRPVMATRRHTAGVVDR
jgi:hypothetical protein